MTRKGIVFGLLGAGILSGLALIVISSATVVPMVAGESGPNGAQVTPTGWVALGLSLFGTGGFTLAGLVAALLNRLGIHVGSATNDSVITEVVELTAAFAALMKDKTNRAAQRRFFFALVDAAKLINGCETSHDGGVIVIKYSGYADPTPSALQGAKT